MTILKSPIKNCCIAIVCSLLLFGITASSTSDLQAQTNSTRKIRLRPSKLAAKAGFTVKWRKSVDEAMKESKKTGKPVFWYVPTIPGSFMDRKTEIDRYMMAGPFSWPTIIRKLNKDFIPVRSRPSRKLAKTYDLLPYKFVEPGFIVVDSAGKLKASRDQLTTLHTQWILETIHKVSGSKEKSPGKFWTSAEGSSTDAAWKKVVSGDFSSELNLKDSQQSAEAMYLKGVLAFGKGDTEQAKNIWKKMSIKHIGHPLAAKAASEREGHGPFVHGLEIYSSVKPVALQAGFKSRGSAAPKSIYSSKTLWQKNVDYLLVMQRKDGSFVDSTYDFGGTDSMPNVYTAVTSLCGTALLDAKKHYPEKAKQIEASIEKARKFVVNPKNINPVDRDEILWAYAYRVRFLCAMSRSGYEVKDDLKTATKKLESVQSKRGNWYHEYNNSFVTATALIALHDAKSCGIAVDENKIKKGLKSLQFDRFENGAFPYYSRRSATQRRREEPVPSAAGRMPICELGLFLWGKSNDKAMEKAVESSLKHHRLLARAYKYDNHTNTYAYGGFFFWYDMRSRAEAILFVKDKEVASNWMKQHNKLVLDLPELDGCFVDSHELGRCYGSAMALLCMGMAEKMEKGIQK